jgi:hypothetical protein
MHMPHSTAEQSAPLAPNPRAGTYELTSTYSLDENIQAEHFYCLPIEAIDREVRVGDLVHVRYKGLEWDLIGRVYKTKKKDLAVHVDFTGWRLPLDDVEVLGLVVETAQTFRH